MMLKSTVQGRSRAVPLLAPPPPLGGTQPTATACATFARVVPVYCRRFRWERCWLACSDSARGCPGLQGSQADLD